MCPLGPRGWTARVRMALLPFDLPPRPSPPEIYRFCPTTRDYFCEMCGAWSTWGGHEKSLKHTGRLEWGVHRYLSMDQLQAG